MSDVQNFFQQEAINKLQALAEGARIAMLCTNMAHIPFSTCPMATQKVDESTGAIWFFTGNDGQHTQDIQADSRVQLIYANNSDSAYLTVSGMAEILDDKAKIDELWSPLAKVWFQGGKDDPNLRLLKVTPQEGFYWDTKHSKMVSFIKMAASIVIGKTMDDGIKGSLTIGNTTDASNNEHNNMENNTSPTDLSGTGAKAKMPTPKETVKSMKGKTNEHDEDLLHGSHNPSDAVTDPAVSILKSEDKP